MILSSLFTCVLNYYNPHFISPSEFTLIFLSPHHMPNLFCPAASSSQSAVSIQTVCNTFYVNTEQKNANLCIHSNVQLFQYIFFFQIKVCLLTVSVKASRAENVHRMNFSVLFQFLCCVYKYIINIYLFFFLTPHLPFQLLIYSAVQNFL